MSRSRTNIEIDDDAIARVMDRFGLHTKTEAVDFALRHVAGNPMDRAEALAMRGAHAIADAPTDSRPVDDS
jgi:Arc/MetJ family transcription regulator